MAHWTLNKVDEQMNKNLFLRLLRMAVKTKQNKTKNCSDFNGHQMDIFEKYRICFSFSFTILKTTFRQAPLAQ